MAALITHSMAGFPDFSPSQARNTHQQHLCSILTKLTQALKPTASAQTLKSEVARAVETVVSAAIQAVDGQCLISIQTYGSSVSGLALPCSDVDLALTGHISETLLSHYKPQSLAYGQLTTQPAVQGLVSLEHLTNTGKIAMLRMAASAIHGAGVCDQPGVALHANARVPVAHFKHTATGLSIDLVCGVHGRQLKATTVLQACNLSSLLAPLYRLVKLWAQTHDLNDATGGTFNSWSLVLLVMFSLQTYRPCHLPPLWKLFVPTLPAPGSPRLLNEPFMSGPDVLEQQRVLQRHMDRCTTWCEGYTAGKADAKQQVGSTAAGASGKEQDSWEVLGALHWFMTLFANLFESWSDGKLSDHRVSVWLGRMNKQPFAIPYRVLLEDPFDISDNAARTFGSMKSATLSLVPYVAHVVRTSERLLRAARGSECSLTDVQAACLWLWGPRGMSHLGPSSRTALGLPPEVQQQVLALMQPLDVPEAGTSRQEQADDELSKASSRRAHLAHNQAHKLLVGLTQLGPHVVLGRAAWQEHQLAKHLAQQCNFEEQEEGLLGFHLDAVEGHTTRDGPWDDQAVQEEAWGFEDGQGSAAGLIEEAVWLSGMAVDDQTGADPSMQGFPHGVDQSPASYQPASLDADVNYWSSAGVVPWVAQAGTAEQQPWGDERHVYPRSEGSTVEDELEAGQGRQGEWRDVELLSGQQPLVQADGEGGWAADGEAGWYEAVGTGCEDDSEWQRVPEGYEMQPDSCQTQSLALSPTAREWTSGVCAPAHQQSKGSKGSPADQVKGVLSPNAPVWPGPTSSRGSSTATSTLSPSAAVWQAGEKQSGVNPEV